MTKKVYMKPNPPQPNKVAQFNSDICNGCNNCVQACPHDVLMPHPEQKKPPIVLYPEECWYCGACVEECSRHGAIAMVHPLNQSIVVRWIRKDTGEAFRLGMKNPPPPNTRPPSGE
jgi:NAD-dependent dihydropyrimidine dehydrogenase PreA subunit